MLAADVTRDSIYSFSILNIVVMMEVTATAEVRAKIAVLIMVEVRGMVGDGGGEC